MPPEQFADHASRHKVYDDEYDSGIASDIWALGIMLYQALSNAHPVRDHYRMAPMEIAGHILWRPFPKIQLDKKYHSLIELCNSMLVKDPLGRLRSLYDFIAETTNFVGKLGQTGTTIYMNDESALELGMSHLTASQKHQLRLLKQREEIWIELANLSMFSFGRRRELMNKLLKMPVA